MRTLAELIIPAFKLLRKTLRIGKRKLIGLALILVAASAMGIISAGIFGLILSVLAGATALFAAVFLLNAAKALSQLRAQVRALKYHQTRDEHSLLALNKELNDKHGQLSEQLKLIGYQGERLQQQQQLIAQKEERLLQQQQLIAQKEERLLQQDEVVRKGLATAKKQKAMNTQLRVKLESSLLDSNSFVRSRDVLLKLTTQAPSRRTRLFCFQALNGQNDYARLIYSTFAKNGFDVFPIDKESDLDSLQGGDLLQLHWTKTMLSGASNIDAAEEKRRHWLSKFQELKDRGVRLVWAVHEALPHECPFPGIEADLRRNLADISDVVQILHPSTPDAVRETFSIPTEKCIVVPHPLYTGSQANYISRNEARARLGLTASDFVLSTFGAIRPYKNHRAVLEILEDLCENVGDRQVKYLIAGPAQSDPEVQEYISSLRREIALNRSDAIVRMYEGAVPADALQFIQKASDLSVCPYNAGLNSGVLMLNLTYNLPTIIRSNPVTDDIAQYGPVMTLKTSTPRELSKKVIAASQRRRFRPVDPAFEECHNPQLISDNFAEQLRTKLEAIGD